MGLRNGGLVGLVAAGLVTAGLVATGGGPAGAAATSAQTAQAKKALLVLSDMPSGWSRAKAPKNPDDNVGDAQLARCIGVASSLVSENPPSVASPQFQDKVGSLMVDDDVTVYPSTQNAAAELALVANPKTPGCLTTLASGPLKSKFFGKTPKGTTFGTPLVSPTDPTTFGSGTAGYSVSVPVTTHGATLNFTVTQLFAVKGRLGQQVAFTSIGVPFSIALEQRLTAEAVARL